MRRKGRFPITRVSALARFFNSVARFLLRDSGGAGTAHFFVSMRGRRGEVSGHKKRRKTSSDHVPTQRDKARSSIQSQDRSIAALGMTAWQSLVRTGRQHPRQLENCSGRRNRVGAHVIGFKTWVSEQRGKVSPSTDVLASETCALSRSAARWPRQ